MRRLCLLSVFLSVVAIVLATIALLTGRGDKTAPPPDTTAAPPDKTGASGAPTAPAVEAKGLLRPVEVATIYPPRAGQVVEIRAKPGERIDPGFEVAALRSRDLEEQYIRALNDLVETKTYIEAAGEALSKPGLSEDDRLRIVLDKKRSEARAKSAQEQLQLLDAQFNNGQPNKPGYFRAVAPPFDGNPTRDRSKWTVLTDDRRESLLGKTLRPNDELMHLGNLDGPWHVELKLPQRNVGQVIKAFTEPGAHLIENDPIRGERRYLVVDLFLSSHPDTSYEGRLSHLAPEAIRDAPGSEPVVPAYVRLNLPSVPKDKWVPTSQLVVGLEVRARIRFSAPPKP